MKKMVRDLEIGDLVDLAGDRFADPEGGNVFLECEFVEVVKITVESDTCIAVGFDWFDVVGFPPNHVVDVQGSMP